jgi:hypothetical protein
MREVQQLGDRAAIKDVWTGELCHWRYPTDKMSKSNVLSRYAAGASIMMVPMSDAGGDQAQAAFRKAQEEWRSALAVHRLAPPNAGFSARLSGLAAAASAEAQACRVADGAGFEWPPHRSSSSAPPYELQPGSGRRGPEELWRRFDGAVSELKSGRDGDGSGGGRCGV